MGQIGKAAVIKVTFDQTPGENEAAVPFQGSSRRTQQHEQSPWGTSGIGGRQRRKLELMNRYKIKNYQRHWMGK